MNESYIDSEGYLVCDRRIRYEVRYPYVDNTTLWYSSFKEAFKARAKRGGGGRIYKVVTTEQVMAT